MSDGFMRKVEKRGALFFVVDEDSRLLGPGYVRLAEAEERLRSAKASTPRQVRTCLSCQKPFESEGSHNRMCRDCKRRGSG